jgi:3-hydroxybutyryl-CoA dehydrogenase
MLFLQLSMGMNIVIRSTENQKLELLNKGFNKGIHVQWLEANKRFDDIKCDAYFDLVFNDALITENEFIHDKPVFVYAVNCICKEINKPNYVRLNAWSSFLDRQIIELAGSNDASKRLAEEILNNLGWGFVWVTDDYGFIAARILAMIINEAYYALEEGVSTKDQIDIAMKLGTNYPFGPFEWSEKIGLSNILNLLRKLSAQDSRYTISATLVSESQ